MIEFNIQRGLSSILFPNGDNVPNPKLIIEKGCWYLCTDTAELFIGVQGENGLTLKRINENTDQGGSIDPEVLEALRGEINTVKESLKDYTKKEELPDVSEFITMQDVEDKNYLTKVPAGYATEEFVTTKIAEAELADKDVDLTSYYTKSEVDNLIEGIELKEGPAGADGEDGATPEIIDGYWYINGESTGVKAEGTDGAKGVDGKDGTNGIDGKDGQNGVTPHIGENGNWFIGDEDTEVKAQGVDGKDGVDGTPGEKGDKGDAFTYEDFTEEQLAALRGEKGDKGDQGEQGPKGEDGKDGLTTSIKVGENTYNHENGIITLPAYATQQDIEDAITDHEGLAKKEEVEEVKTTLTTTVIPVVTEIVPLKANDVPFTESKIVGNSLGGFVAGEDLKGLTIAKILAKLLGLSEDEPGENPDVPDVPTEPEGVVEEIIANKLPMYSVNADGTITAEDFKIISFTTEESAAAPSESGFYQIVNEAGEVVESGYQDLMIVNDEMYYVIALPKNVDYNTMVKIQTYDDEEQKWLDNSKKLALTSDPETVAALCDEAGIDISHINSEAYTIWALEDTCTGKKIRYIIEETE
jgi:hypothetical protein